MNDERLDQLIGAAIDEKVRSYTPEPTADCPPFERFIAVREEGAEWMEEERTHLRTDCEYCRRTRRMMSLPLPEPAIAVTAKAERELLEQVQRLRELIVERDAALVHVRDELAARTSEAENFRIELQQIRRDVQQVRPAARPTTPAYLPWTVAAVLAVGCLLSGGIAVSQAAAISELRSRVDQLDLQLEQSGVRTAMIGSISASGRSRVRVEAGWDTRFVSGATLTIGDRVVQLEGRRSDDRNRRTFDESFDVELDGRTLEAVLEFQPVDGVAERLPEFFSPEDRRVDRTFLASAAGLITDPETITVPAELEQMTHSRHVNAAGTAEPNCYIVSGQVYEDVAGMTGWLIVDPLLSSNKFVGSRLSVTGSRFHARCYLGNNELDEQPYVVLCVFHRDKDALNVDQQLPKDFDWEAAGFVVAPSEYKVNDGDDGFDAMPGRD